MINEDSITQVYEFLKLLNAAPTTDDTFRTNESNNADKENSDNQRYKFPKYDHKIHFPTVYGLYNKMTNKSQTVFGALDKEETLYWCIIYMRHENKTCKDLLQKSTGIINERGKIIMRPFVNYINDLLKL